MKPERFDVVVAGSGAAGMTAALAAASRGLSVVVIEKTGYFGGSTARSGGGVWVPQNSVLRKAGIPDTAEQASNYLAYVASESVPRLRRAFLDGEVALGSIRQCRSPRSVDRNSNDLDA